MTEPEVRLASGLLVAAFDQPVRACSWAIQGGGLIDTRHVVWVEVRDGDLVPHVEPRDVARDGLRRAGVDGGVALLTSRRVASYARADVSRAGATAVCLATVGLSNALRAGDPCDRSSHVGTINLLVHVTVPLADPALIEASAVATEAKCAAVLEARVRSRVTGQPATGTGTDCVVVTSARRPEANAIYAGKHTPAGSVIGAAVERAVAEGVRRWLVEYGHGEGA